jgi:PAS domain S-box-containing protein
MRRPSQSAAASHLHSAYTGQSGDIRMPGSTVNQRDIPPANPLDGVHTLRGLKAEDRRIAPHRSSAEVLQGRPAEMLRNRLDSATIVIGLDGFVVYANPACERLLGYQAAKTLEGQSVTTLLAGQSDTPASACIELLCDPGIVTNWNHSDGYPVATLASDPMLLDYTDLMLMVSLMDVSDRVWAAVDRANRFWS